jgi:hypothetical protein
MSQAFVLEFARRAKFGVVIGFGIRILLQRSGSPEACLIFWLKKRTQDKHVLFASIISPCFSMAVGLKRRVWTVPGADPATCYDQGVIRRLKILVLLHVRIAVEIHRF